MHAYVLKTFFPDILNFEKAPIKANPKDLKPVNNLNKVLVEDAELFKRLATNEPLNK